MWDSESESSVSWKKTAIKSDGFEQKDHSWYVASETPCDLLVQIGDTGLHVHKYPLISRSGKINRIIYESGDTERNKVALHDLPGGAEAFELAVRFCYGMAVDLTATNISTMRCAAEFLEMTEDLEEGNLIFKTEAFLSYVVLSSWRDSIVVLKSCENLSPWAENLQIVRRCSESIAWKACSNPKGVKWQYTGKLPRPVLNTKSMEEMESSPKQAAPADWWFEDVSVLRIDHFVRVITAIRVKGMRHDLIGDVIVHYANKWLPGDLGVFAADEGVDRSGNGRHTITAGPEIDGNDVATRTRDQKLIVESLISIIPPQKGSVSCSFLLKLVRISSFLKLAPALMTELEKRIGSQLDQAAVSDLIIPCYNKNDNTLYDVDLVQRLLENFLMEQPESRGSSSSSGYTENSQISMNSKAYIRVARLVDSYLTEISSDRNLFLSKFQVIAEAMPGSARISDDGFYRAVDSYLKAHPNLTEHERKRLCRVLDCEKLSIDACMHIAQNERLPLRIVVQVLLAEMVKVKNSLTNYGGGGGGESNHHALISNRKTLLDEMPESFQEEWSDAKKDINTLKFELQTLKNNCFHLQNELEAMQRGNKPAKSKWSIGWMKLGKTSKPMPENDVTTEEQTKKAHRGLRYSIS